MTELYILGNPIPYQMFGALILTERRTVVLDGGLREDAPRMRELLQTCGRDRMDAWFFTHPHHDHIGVSNGR